MSMNLSRRQFVLSSAAVVGAAGLGLPARAWQPTTRPAPDKAASGTFNRWVEVRPGFHVAIGRTGEDFALLGGNSTLITGKDGAALIDTKQAVVAPALRREALTKGSRLTHVFNTHHHFDHSGGNGVFAKDGTLAAHPKAVERIKSMTAAFTTQLPQQITALEAAQVEGAKQAAKDARAFEKSLADVKSDAWVPTPLKLDEIKAIAGRKAELHHVGPGHTDNDVFFFFPDDNVLVAGDLVFNNLHPYFDKDAAATSAGWVRSLARMVELCDGDTVVVPGHGDISTVDAVKKQIKYFEDVRAMVEKALSDGKPREEVEKMALPAYAPYGLNVARPLVLGGVYDELKK